MNISKRNKRVRKLVKTLNKERKRQAKKIDILCNDFVEAQRNFIKRLETIAFAADFYETIIGTTELSSLLNKTGKIIQTRIPDSNVVFFIKTGQLLESHLLENTNQDTDRQNNFLDSFTPEVIDNINKANKICTLQELLPLGLHLNPQILARLSAATVPLGQNGQTAGFVLIYLPSQEEISLQQINSIAAVTSGLSQAIQSCKAHLNSPK